MSDYWVHLKALLKKLGLAFLMFTLCRIAFYVFNTNHFSNVGISEFFYGIRFDMVAISFLFAPIAILQLIPFPFRNFNRYQKISNIIFYLILSISMAVNLIDVAYYDYTFKRTTADLFGMVSTGDDFFTLLPHYIIDFWYAYVICGVFIYLGIKLYRRFCTLSLVYHPYYKKDYFFHSIIFIVFCGFLILGMRGGFQYKPLTIVNAAKHTESQNISIILNTPFTVMKTISSDKVEQIKFFSDDELNSIFTPEQYIEGKPELEGKNVVLFILESFSKEYIGGLNDSIPGYTPFLDSLLEESYVYTNAFANASTSMGSLPCILAGLPQLMSSPYIISNYSNNIIDGLPKTLKEHGYSTSFYHGGANGTMGFDGFASIVGIENYYGLNEYPKELRDANFDGLWGIFDEPYLQYYSDDLDKKKEPFFSTIFTLSSHHPYTIPNKHKGSFPAGSLPIHESLGYTDYALKKFFKTSKNKEWFNNTIFVFTADHSSLSETSYYKTKLNRFAIPSFIYDPSGSLKGSNSEFFQQIDITPTLLNLLNIKDSIITFGNSPQNSGNKYFIGYSNDNYIMAFSDYFLMFNGENSTHFYNLKNDPLLSKNIIKTTTKEEQVLLKKMETKLKAIIQQYNHRIINNQLSKNNQY
jgi:phosphoglycerol transferase MdoB-like AlkP superfamily enzyme